MPRSRLFFAVLAAIALASCGGGGSSGSSPTVPTVPGNTPAPNTPAPTTPAPPVPQSTPPSTPQQTQVAGATAFVTSSGMTLYLFGADTSGHSNCSSSNGCTGVWPPYTAPSGTTAPSGFTLTARSDGTMQWTFNGWPLYRYIGDAKPGDNNGNGLNQFGGLWQTARPSAGAAGSGSSGGGGGGNPY